MSDKGEKACPLCTEDMDLTDQQLKPCKCGYEICVWCWNHIMEMAERDDTEGRCPACRSPYDKEKIVGTAASCERLVAEINSERKQKLQKAKPKASEGRKHLSDVRVIQRNLVYIIGLPLNLADEDLLQCMEYFGQYGKVLKVSISRTATGVIQHSSNNSCCVYITYSKEEEAVRCIQSVHNFVLEGRSLRACFGTSKYCHSWLRNVPCSNSDCLYLHDFGSQEDSFIKDEIVSAFTRSRVQQIIGATNNLHRRSGNVLPPPADEYSNINISSPAKLIAKSPSNNIGNQVSVSCADSGTIRSNGLPVAASWVKRVSTSLPPVSMPGSGESPNTSKKSTCDVRRSMIVEESCEVHPNGKLYPLELTEHCSDKDSQTAVSSTGAEIILDTTPAIVTSSNSLPCLPSSKDVNRDIAASPTSTSSLEVTKLSCSPCSDEVENFHADGEAQSPSGLSLLGIHSHPEDEYSIPVVPNSSISNNFLINLPGNQNSQEDNKHLHEPSTSLALRNDTSTKELLDFDDRHLNCSEGIRHLPPMSCSPTLLQKSNQSSCHFWREGEVGNKSNLNARPRIVSMKGDEVALPLTSGDSVSFNGLNDNKADIIGELDTKFDRSSEFSDVGKGKCLGRCDNNIAVNNNVASGTGESSIISDILSLDSDAWGDSLTSPHSLVKLLSESDKHGSLKIPSLRKAQSSNQSRFSFARQEDFVDQVQEDFVDQVSHLEHSCGNIRHVPNKCSASHDLMENKDRCMGKYQDTFLSSSVVEPDYFLGSHSFTSSKLSGSQAPILTPPGFSVPNRAPPPGFSPHGRVDQAFDSSVNHLHQTSIPATRTVGSTGDVEFNDPAILEVGKGILTTGLFNAAGFGTRPTLSQQLSHFEHEARLQRLMQQSSSAPQNHSFPDYFGNRSTPPNNAHSIPSMLPDQSQTNNPTAFSHLSAQQFRAHISNSHWVRSSEVKNVGDLGMAEVLTSQRLGFIPRYEDLKFQMSGSGSLYNRGFGM